MVKRKRLSSVERLREIAYHEAGHCIMELHLGVIPEQVQISETRGTTSGGLLEELEDYEWDLICLAGTVAEHIYKGEFTRAVAQVLSGIIPDGAQSDFCQLRVLNGVDSVDGMLLVHDLLLSERWIVLSRVAELLHSKRILNSEEIDDIAQQLSQSYRNIERLASIKKIHLNRWIHR